MSSTHSWSPELKSGSFYEYNGDAGHPITQAFGVRCVLDLNSIRTISGCPGALNNNCYPNAVWSSSIYSGNSYYYDGYLNNGTFNGPHSGSNLAAVSVRCVLDLKSADNCYPNVVWSGTVQSGSNYYHGNLNGGTFNATTSNYSAYTYARGVRCVLDLKFTLAPALFPDSAIRNFRFFKL